MRVFVTGASGFIGSAVVKELLGAGHQVLGLARSDGSAKAIVAAGAEVLRGSLDDLESLERGASSTDGVIHTAFNHDFTDFAVSTLLDQQAIEAMGAALAGTNRPLVVSSGVLGLPSGRVVTEDDTHGPALPRKSEAAALATVAQGVRATSIRLSPSVHGEGDHHGFVPMIIRAAREKGLATYVGDGKNHWPAVHLLDAARLFRLALEKGAPGGIFHAVGDEGIATREIVERIARRLDVPTVSRSAEEASQSLGFVGFALTMDCQASTTKTRETLGWKPTGPGLLEDIDHGHYFAT